MPSESLTNTFSANTRIRSSEVNQNFTDNRTFIGCKAYHDAGQNNIPGAPTKVTLTTEVYDIGSNFDTGNSRFEAPVDGYYYACGQARFADASDQGAYWIYLYYNGSQVARTTQNMSRAANGSITIGQLDMIEYLNAGEYIELYARGDNVADLDADSGTGLDTFLVVQFVGV